MAEITLYFSVPLPSCALHWLNPRGPSGTVLSRQLPGAQSTEEQKLYEDGEEAIKFYNQNILVLSFSIHFCP